jgi:adenosylcobinamide-GDP ribazoletransferase
VDQDRQSSLLEHLRNWTDDLGLAGSLLTRIPLPQPASATLEGMARAQRAFPLIGAIVGLAIGLFDRALLAIGIPELAAAVLALGAGALLTGALHEDGLADVADGFGGSSDREKKLAIMRDSRIGTYGVLALLVSFIAKCSALASLPLTEIIPALVVAHTLARAAIPAVTANMPFARDDGLGRSAGRPDTASAVIAAVIAIVIALLCLPFGIAVLAVVITALAAGAIALLAWRQIGGVTGDVFGAIEQTAETAVLLVLSAQFA